MSTTAGTLSILAILLYLFFVGLGIYVIVLLIFFLKRGRQAFEIYIAKNRDNFK